jgi:hypothetical protein
MMSRGLLVFQWDWYRWVVARDRRWNNRKTQGQSDAIAVSSMGQNVKCFEKVYEVEGRGSMRKKLEKKARRWDEQGEEADQEDEISVAILQHL